MLCISKILGTILVMCVSLGAAAQTDSQSDHHAGVVQRGESHAGMGFSQSTTTHHFILTPNGGIVRVTANDPQNTEQIETIQMHMKHIARMFSEGNFSLPHFVHDQTPPGVSTMKELKNTIQYLAKPLSNGGCIKIETSSPDGIAAIHDFLRFQIEDHETGDPLTVKNWPYTGAVLPSGRVKPVQEGHLRRAWRVGDAGMGLEAVGRVSYRLRRAGLVLWAGARMPPALGWPR